MRKVYLIFITGVILSLFSYNELFAQSPDYIGLTGTFYYDSTARMPYKYSDTLASINFWSTYEVEDGLGNYLGAFDNEGYAYLYNLDSDKFVLKERSRKLKGSIISVNKGYIICFNHRKTFVLYNVNTMKRVLKKRCKKMMYTNNDSIVNIWSNPWVNWERCKNIYKTKLKPAGTEYKPRMIKQKEHVGTKCHTILRIGRKSREIHFIK